MKKILFVCSHVGSGSSSLCELLSTNSRIQCYNCGPYANPLNLLALVEQRHKRKDRAAIYLNELLYNHQLYTKAAYSSCSFIYLIRPPQASLGIMIKEGYKPLYALRYYTYRLRRFCEMASGTKGAVFLAYDDLFNGGIGLIENYLNVKIEVPFVNQDVVDRVVPANLLLEAESAYEKTLFFMKNQSLVCLNKA